MAELKAGGLALIIGLRNYHEFNGRCVKIIQLIGPNDNSARHPVIGEVFRFGPACIGAWFVSGDIYPGGYPELRGCGVLSSKNLIPLDEDFSDELFKEREVNC